VAIAADHKNAKVVQHPFENYPSQNYAISLAHSFLLLDADERLTTELKRRLLKPFMTKNSFSAYYCCRAFILKYQITL
jgi:hypothetical protein